MPNPAEELAATVRERLGERLIDSHIHQGQLTVSCAPEHLVDVCVQLRDDELPAVGHDRLGLDDRPACQLPLSGQGPQPQGVVRGDAGHRVVVMEGGREHAPAMPLEDRQLGAVRDTMPAERTVR